MQSRGVLHRGLSVQVYQNTDRGSAEDLSTKKIFLSFVIIRSEYGNNEDYGTNDDDSSSEQADEETRGRKRPANVMKGADTNFLYAESKAAR